MKKVSEKAGKIPLIGNNHRKDLSCNLAGQKRVHLWNTSKCSLPFSPGKQDKTIPFSIGQGPDKEVLSVLPHVIRN